MNRESVDPSAWSCGALPEEEIKRDELDEGVWDELSECASPLSEEHTRRVVTALQEAWASRLVTDARCVRADSGCLFTSPDSAVVCDSPKQEGERGSFRSLVDVVRSAYVVSHAGLSIDRVVADPDATARFVRECWKRGAQASQFELTWCLYNARKANKIGRVDGIVRHSVSREALERYLWAAEIAMRVVQDEAYYQRQMSLSLDRILCDPNLAGDFEQLARRLAPGFSSAEYRWAALNIRKSQDRSEEAVTARNVSFEQFGSLEDVTPSKLPKQSGLYWLHAEGRELLIGRTENIRAQVDSLMQSPDGGWKKVPGWLANRVAPFKRCGTGRVQIAVATGVGTSDDRESVKRSLIKSANTLFNSYLPSWGVGAA